ncbi:MAG TPA: M1 family aminopeptidase, partial [Acidobacteriota bacterium]|nr:M1 family aminopeptidase [Acidobacteriota bacterium]
MRTRTILAAVLLIASSLAAADDPTYAALRAARPDGRFLALANATFDRDAYHFTLNGSLSLLAPVNGTTFGAVFVGTGSYTLTPATGEERHQLAMNSGDDKLTALSDSFGSAVFFDTALIQELQKTAGDAKPGEANGEASRAFDDFLKSERKDFTTNFHIRLLQEILDPQSQPLFFAFIHGKKVPPAILAVDPRGAEALRLFDIGAEGESTALYVQDDKKGGIWYLARPAKGDASGPRAAAPGPAATAERYEIDTTIAANNKISGTTVMTFTGQLGGRVLGLSLAPQLRIDSVEVSPGDNPSSWQPVPFIQENADEDADSAVVFPNPLIAGAKYLLRTKYHGIGKAVLHDAGDGNFTVGARDSWYPNVGSFRDPADFLLTFRMPQKSRNQVVAVGVESENKLEGDERVSIWTSTHPLRVAGFNYGNFKKMAQTDDPSGMTVEVYTNPGDPDILREIQQAVAASGEIGSVNVSTAGLAQAAFADGANTARTGNAFFGPLEDKRIAITQQSAWFYGQSWPTLVYLPYLAFIDSTTRNVLGFGSEAADFVDQVGAHEVAHQWWGHKVGWRTYHDAWLSEGFAEFTSG